MTHRFVTTILLLVAVLSPGPAALAQPLEMKGPPSKPERPAREIPDRDLRPSQPAVPHKPGFIPGLSNADPDRTDGCGRVDHACGPVGRSGRGGSGEQRRGRLRIRSGVGRPAAWDRELDPTRSTGLDAVNGAG